MRTDKDNSSVPADGYAVFFMIMIDLYLYLYLYLYFYLYLYGYACFYFYLSTPINNLYLKRSVVKFSGNQATYAPEEKKSYREKHVILFYPYRKKAAFPCGKRENSRKTWLCTKQSLVVYIL